MYLIRYKKLKAMELANSIAFNIFPPFQDVRWMTVPVKKSKLISQFRKSCLKHHADVEAATQTGASGAQNTAKCRYYMLD